jgi:hypothetical protein
MPHLNKNGIVIEPIEKIDNVCKTGPKTFELKSAFTLKGPLHDSYAQMEAARGHTDKLAALRTARLEKGGGTESAPTQAAVMKELFTLGQNATPSGTGHPSVKMTRITLDTTLKLRVGGMPRDITHLYTQTVDDREIRCYLGNAEGAYQRVHTSLTREKSMTAHTMVQTGPEVAVPGWKGSGTRVGFNSTEEPGKGVRDRGITFRTGKDSTVDKNLTGQDWSELSEEDQRGAVWLAENFNELLDRVFIEVVNSRPNEREVTRTTVDFELLDDSWNFPDGTAATPGVELRRRPLSPDPSATGT